jgi:hypothetical protein
MGDSVINVLKKISEFDKHKRALDKHKRDLDKLKPNLQRLAKDFR